MPKTMIDHIVITSPSLETGVKFIKEKLGIEAENGGEHAAMGTHNKLLRLGDSMYLEVIAVNPDARAPQRARWFGLDRLPSDTLPALSAWVARVPDIKLVPAAARELLGEIKPMSRGGLNWLITIPDDGIVPLAGVAPALIEWRTSDLPANRLRDFGLSLLELQIYHPDPGAIERLFSAIELEGPLSVCRGERPHLRAVIETPSGVREL